MRLWSILATCAIVAATALPVRAAEMTPGQRKSIESVVQDFLLRNPEVIERAMQALEAKREAAKEHAATTALDTYRRDLFESPASPVGGNVNGDVTLVEFFDYRCGVCRRVHPIVGELTASDGRIRRIYVEWPILGPESVFAASAALAARHQGNEKYLRFHDLMMESRGRLDRNKILSLAEQAGLDRGRLERDLGATEIARVIKRNYEIATALGLNGTPSFVIGRKVIRGGRDLNTMRQLVAEAREEARRGAPKPR